jgi:hypothetical protein
VSELRYGLLRKEDLSGGESDISPSATKARRDAFASTSARLTAFEEQRLAHEVNCAAYYIAKGPFKFSGSISWTHRADDRERAATLTLHPLPSRSVEELLRAGIISPMGVNEEAFRRAVEEQRL